MLRLAIVNLLDGIPVEAEQDGTWVAQDNRRVSRDQELRVPWCCQVVDDLEERELSLRRQRRLGLVQNDRMNYATRCATDASRSGADPRRRSSIAANQRTVNELSHGTWHVSEPLIRSSCSWKRRTARPYPADPSTSPDESGTIVRAPSDSSRNDPSRSRRRAPRPSIRHVGQIPSEPPAYSARRTDEWPDM